MTNEVFLDYNAHNNVKGNEKKSRLPMPFREPRFGGKGYGERCRTWSWSRSVDEALPGVPVTAFEAASAANQGGTAMIKPSPLFSQGDGFLSYK